MLEIYEYKFNSRQHKQIAFSLMQTEFQLREIDANFTLSSDVIRPIALTTK